jgi:tetratricopeptide (TPR) repeat protein
MVKGQISDDEEETIEQDIRQQLSSDSGWHFETFRRQSELKLAVSEHVLSYKSVLYELTKAYQQGNLENFVKIRWRELTPSAFSSGIIASTGLIRGFDAAAMIQDTGKSLDFCQTLEAFQDFFAEVQFLVWINLINSEFTENYTLEDALAEHVVSGGIFNNNTAKLGNVIEELKSNKQFTLSRTWYTILALHANVLNATGDFSNNLAADWALNYFLFEMHLQDIEKKSFINHYKISNHRAAQTISEQEAWNVIAYIINQFLETKYDSELFNRTLIKLEKIAQQLGYDDLVGRVGASISVAGKIDDPLAYVCAILDRPEVKELPGRPVSILYQLSKFIISCNDVNLIELIFQHAEPMIAGNREDQAQLEAWFGECLKLLRQPNRFLECVGEQPRDWEYELSTRQRLALWNERLNAFRLLGNPQHALEIAETLLKEIELDSRYKNERFVLLRNRGILLREVGAFDESLNQLRWLIDYCTTENQVSLLDSYSVTCHLMGRFNEAIDALNLALNKLKKCEENESYVAKLKSSLAQIYASVNRFEEALKTLDEIQNIKCSKESSFIEAAAYLILLANHITFQENHNLRFQELIRSIFEQLDDAEAREDTHLMMRILPLLGHAMAFKDEDKSEKIWHDLLTLLKRKDLPPDPVALARLAAAAYKRKDRDEAIKLLGGVPFAFAGNFGAVQDIHTAFDATFTASFSLKVLMETAVNCKAPLADIRFIADLNRDTIGSSIYINKNTNNYFNISLYASGIPDKLISTLAPKSGSAGIIEWIDSADGIFPLFTTINTEGQIDTVILKTPKFDLFKLRDRIMQRLNVWHAGRDGDPFDLPAWRELENWTHDEIGSRLADGDHVTFINHQLLVGLPWHVALSPFWRCSYSPSWMTLFGEKEPVYNIPLKIGVFSAPRYEDSKAVRNSFLFATDRTQRWADEKDHICKIYANESADLEALKDLMATCDVVQLLCHGFASHRDHEIALLVSHSGALPPMYAPNSAILPDTNRVSWRDFQFWPKMPPLVLSVACSTGLQWQAGAGEQMGLFGAMRRGGTHSFIAPRWDVPADVVLPLLDKVLVKYFDEKTSLIDALHLTSIEAENNLPRWLSWSLALEGNWK